MIFVGRGEIFANVKCAVNYLALVFSANKINKLALIFQLCPVRAENSVRQSAVRAVVPVPASAAAFQRKPLRQAFLQGSKRICPFKVVPAPLEIVAVNKNLERYVCALALFFRGKRIVLLYIAVRRGKS